MCFLCFGTTSKEGVTIMGGKTNVAKGRIKEAAGALTGNDRLRAEGRADQAVGKTKQAVQKTINTVRKALKKAAK
jgi:uncharacterized protein YjbJ (UPF0337 family)